MVVLGPLSLVGCLWEKPLLDPFLPFTLETQLEQRLADQPEWREGVEWGRPRPGHPEGTIKAHIASVLANVDGFYRDSPWRCDLRLVALVHDTFKYQVDGDRPRTGDNHHALRARRFAERFIKDHAVLEVIELHDDAFNAWQLGNRDGNWDRAHERALRLTWRLGGTLPFYLAFYRCDNATTGKQPACWEWFRELSQQ